MSRFHTRTLRAAALATAFALVSPQESTNRAHLSLRQFPFETDQGAGIKQEHGPCAAFANPGDYVGPA